MWAGGCQLPSLSSPWVLDPLRVLCDRAGEGSRCGVKLTGGFATMSSPRRHLGTKRTLQQQKGKASRAPHTSALLLPPPACSQLWWAAMCSTLTSGLATATPQRKNSVRRILELRSCQMFYLLAIPSTSPFFKVSEKACRPEQASFHVLQHRICF